MNLFAKFWARDDSPDADSWESIRRPPRHGDEALTGTARQWLRRLPSGRRPLNLCMQYPRVANQIAWTWRDAAMTTALLDELLTDRRGGRTGFPKAVALELRRLRDFNDRDTAAQPPHGYLAALRSLLSEH